MVQNFRQLGISSGQNLPLPDCFNLKEGFNRFPAMTFHFQGADFKVKQNKHNLLDMKPYANLQPLKLINCRTLGSYMMLLKRKSYLVKRTVQAMHST